MYWYGLGFEEIANMRITAIGAYLERLPKRQAETKLVFSEVVSVPQMEESDRRDMLNAWMRAAGLDDVPAQVATPGQLKMMGIGVRHTPAPE